MVRCLGEQALERRQRLLGVAGAESQPAPVETEVRARGVEPLGLLEIGERRRQVPLLRYRAERSR